MNPQRERLLDLLADRALGGLDLAESAELGHLMTLFPDSEALAQELEIAAAAAALATVSIEAAPPAVLARVAARAGSGAAPRPLATRTVLMPDAPVRAIAPAPPRAGRGFAIAGWLAAAACLLLAVGVGYWRPRTKVVAVVAPPIDPVAERAGLLARAGTARLDWSVTPEAGAAQGDVVWNAAEQRGFMRFRGLARNDRSRSVYQLWIFDRQRDDKFPVDGGVFDIDADGDVVVPIEAKLPVGEVALFAVTVEKPGGVVVSKREHVVVTAKPAG